MSSIYKKLYAYMVGEVDGALQILANGYPDCADRSELLLTIGARLKGALAAAEEMYIESAEEEENGSEGK